MSASSNPEPTVSVVTPARNMGRFIRDTIDSVLAQDYASLEYLVCDGASTDDTAAILRSYGDRVRWVSEPDRGQAHAINKGFAATSGEIFTFLNADDLLAPGAVRNAVEAFRQNPQAAVVYGAARHVDEQGTAVCDYPTGDPAELATRCCICQPAAFIRRGAFVAVNEALHYALDYDLWLRIRSAGGEFVRVPEVLAYSRMHAENKTLGSRGAALSEAIEVVKRNLGYAGFEPLYAYACWLEDGKDQFFEPTGPSAAKFARTVSLGWRHNRAQRGRWLQECLRELAAYGRRRTAG